MRVLFIGGTGLISSACSELAVSRGMELFILNRNASRKYPLPEGAQLLVGDVHGDELRLARLLAGRQFDVVVDWIAFTPWISKGISACSATIHTTPPAKPAQFVFISSASAYQKPPQHYVITEETPLENPFWEYSRNKIACEERLMQAYHEIDFPVTIVRPSSDLRPLPDSLVRRELAASLYRHRPDEKRQGDYRAGRRHLIVGSHLERRLRQRIPGVVRQ